MKEEDAWTAWRNDPRPLGLAIPRDERVFKDGYRAGRLAARAEVVAEINVALTQAVIDRGDSDSPVGIPTITEILDRLALLPPTEPKESKS